MAENNKNMKCDIAQNSQILLNQEIQNTKTEINSKINDLTHLYQNKESLVINETIDKIKLAIEIAPDNFKNFILEEISKTQPLTNGQEGEIFKINIDKKQYIIAKKRFDIKSKEEVILHKEAYEISKSSSSGIKVPEVFYEFNDEKNGYIIMEYIEGKTLYTLIWQEMINSELIPIIENKIFQDQAYKKYHIDLNDFKTQYKDFNNKIELKDDYESQSAMRIICGILLEIGYLDGNFDSYTINPISNQRYYKTEQTLLNKFLNQLKLFEENDKLAIINKLKIFLDDMHKKGFYHRDLGKNFRNIIINGTDVTIIDFGRAINNKPTNYDYENGHYTKDNDIINNISKTNSQKKEKQNTSKINNEKIIFSGKKLGLEITEREISANLNFKSTNIENVLSDFISGKDNKYNWFIYLTNKPGNKDFKQKEESTTKGKKKLFILLNIIDSEKLEKLNKKIEEYLKMGKGSREYKYAMIFKEYINNIL